MRPTFATRASRRARARTALAIAFVATACVSDGQGSSPVPEGRAIPVPEGRAAPEGGGLQGIATNDTTPTASRYENLRRLERQLGTRVRIFRLYSSIRRPGFSPDDLAVVRHVGAVVISMDVPRRAGWRSIPAGRWDAELDAWATTLRGLADDGVTLYLVALTAEPENPQNSRGTAADYVAGARYFVRFMRSEGVPARFVFAPMLFRFGAKMEQWYPGDPFIDVIAPDGYNWSGPQSCDGSATFGQMFDPVVDEAIARGKLWGVSEYGVTHRDDAPSYQASWLRDAALFIEEHRSNFAYATYWYNDARCDWTYHTKDAFDAFRGILVP